VTAGTIYEKLAIYKLQTMRIFRVCRELCGDVRHLPAFVGRQFRSIAMLCADCEMESESQTSSDCDALLKSMPSECQRIAIFSIKFQQSLSIYGLRPFYTGTLNFRLSIDHFLRAWENFLTPAGEMTLNSGLVVVLKGGWIARGGLHYNLGKSRTTLKGHYRRGKRTVTGSSKCNQHETGYCDYVSGTAGSSFVNNVERRAA
jgi:hypothetical protein